MCVCFISTSQLILNLSDELIDASSPRDNSFSKCYSKEVFVDIYFYSGVILLPLFELFIYPVFHRCLEVIESSWKVICGPVLLLVEILALLVIETMARHNYLDNFNNTIPCMGHGTLSAAIDFRWMAVPKFLHFLSVCLLGIGVYCISSSLFNERTYNGNCLLYVCSVCSCGNRHKCSIH